LEEAKKQPPEKNGDRYTSSFGMDNEDVVGEQSLNIVRVCQRIKLDLGEREEIWVLVEFEMFDPDLDAPVTDDNNVPKRTKKWKQFNSENLLQDFIRRDTGEPLQLPPYSLTPQQSQQIQQEARSNVSKITEDFRRFRVKSEMARKQADTQIRDLQSSNVESAKKRIAGQDVVSLKWARYMQYLVIHGNKVAYTRLLRLQQKELEQARSEYSRLERMRIELSQQESQWKEAYDLLLLENKKLKSSGSEALLASQWRQRYETCLNEKNDLESKLKMKAQKAEDTDGKYEVKYRDLKESFRLYRKKAKEIFVAQQSGAQGAPMMNVDVTSSENSKLSYLKNLMVNYLTSDLDVREHMEGAIGTVLRFTPEDIAKIEAKKAESDYWAYLGYT
jgi:hypothetical protein